MRISHHHIVLSLFLFVATSITRAQTISSQKGLTTAIFTTPQGNVKVFLPDDIRPGDMISGTVIAEPKGNNARQIERNLVELIKYSISIDETKCFFSDQPTTIKCLVRQDRQVTASLELLNVNGVKAQELTLKFIQTKAESINDNRGSISGCIIPSHALADAPCKITGSFDGNAANTNCTVNNQPMKVLAESPRQCIVQYPANAQGPGTMQVKENGQEKCTRQISGVDMQVTTGDLNLRKGQSTYIDIKITGLQNLPDKAVLTIINTTPNVVTMTNGNTQVIPVWPRPDSANGTFSIHCPAVSITTGNFVVEINLDLPQPGDAITPANEVPPGYTKKSCNCGVTATVSKSGNSFTAAASPACTGVYGIGISTFCACTTLSTTYNWSVGSGQENVELVGKVDGTSVNVRPKNNGDYTVCVVVTTTCIDGTVCTTSACADQSGKTVSKDPPVHPPTQPKIPTRDSIPTTDTFTTVGMVCLPDVQENADPKMVGGLKSKQTGTGASSTIFRDDFVALQAEGSDIDLVTFMCNPQKPCQDSKSQKTIPVTGKVRFEWEITSGEGKFVKLGCGSEDEKKDKGEHIVFQPPYVALPVKNADTTLTTIITLTILDDGSPITDAPVVKIITIKTTRKKALPDKYVVDVTGGAADKPAAPALPVAKGTCELIGPTWKPGDNLVEPEIILPGVADAGKMVLGQWILLRTQDQSDPDPLSFNCKSSNCTSSGGGKSYPDNIIWEWSKTGGGDFILGNNGQYIIYQAPMEMPAGKTVIEIKIKLKVMNPTGERHDPDKLSKEFTLYIYQPGVKLTHPELSWLPEENNSLELRSELMYKDGDWKPALAHMCRIHYFELMSVSTEKGVCLNNPVPKDADQCRDLQLKNEAGHEAWDDTKASGTKCDTKDLFQQARTKRPEKIYTITIHSRDFGAYGFLRSFANVNKKTSLEGKPLYVSIPVKRTDVTHPLGRPKKTEYTDNRVTIPHDIDENRIADGGWMVFGGAKVNDPANNNDDEDEEPVGDGFKGDGLSTYEEYRGFKILDGASVIHQRTDYQRKDIFIHKKEAGLDINLYTSISELDVHLINEDQYVDNKTRVVNSNFNPTTHIVNQMGLRLVDKLTHSSLLGIAVSVTNQPAIPNQEVEIIVYSKKIAEACKKRGLEDKIAEKMRAVIAHELLHGNNVCHHGEGDPGLEKQADAVNGLRSGNVACVMRYDNVGTIIRNHNPEAIGSSLCTSAAGTGYNINGQLFGNAAAKRGNCKTQIRVSGKGNPPRSCGNR